MTSPVDGIQLQDCIAGMQSIPEGSVDLVFADPPFNIGYKYDAYDDSLDSDEYLGWSRDWMSAAVRAIKPDGTFWLAIGDDYAAELKVMLTRELGLTCRSWVIWYYTFGVNCKNKFSRSHTHLFHMVKDADQFTFNADDPGIRIPSARQLVYGDKRANPKGRLPDDTWILRPQDIPESFAGDEELVMDPFIGSGTTLAVAKKLGRQHLGFELSEEYAAQASERLESISNGDPLTGAENPLTSVPSTKDGTRLEDREAKVSKTRRKTRKSDHRQKKLI
jgi:DNA modification methylase